MAATTPMMAAIAAARRSERKKKKAGAGAGAPSENRRNFHVGEKVQYWSDSKGKWIDAVVLKCSDTSGVVTYDLTVKARAVPDKVRALPESTDLPDLDKPPAPTAPVSSFISFDGFGGKQPKKRGRDSESEEELGRAGALHDGDAAEQAIDWTTPPSELLLREQVGDGRAAAFIDHFVRFVLGAWKCQQAADFPGFSDVERAAFGGSALEETREAMVPLLTQLARGEKLERGETKPDRIRMSGARTGCDGRHVDEAGVLEQLDSMASSAAKRDYAEAHKAYMTLTLGHKKWNNTCVTHVSANSMSGAREYRRNRDSLNTYDIDPVAQKYMQGMRKIIHFAQRIRPNDDQSKNVML